MGLQIHLVYDLQGWCCVSIITFVWLYNTLYVPKLILFPHYEEQHIPAAVIVLYYMVSLCCITSLVRASFADPGQLPQDPDIPYSERQLWEICNKCNKMRPKRSHHCSRCGHCVRKMDHHCPWINNCVGEDNHWLFLQLCFYTELLSFLTLLFNFCQYYYLEPLTKVKEELFVFRHELAMLRISTLMGIVMFGGMFGLFYGQLSNVIADMTTIERMSSNLDEMLKSSKPWQQTFSEVFGTRWKILWFIPFRQRQPLRVSYHHANHV
ncbi:palmitoyltransferase ZDHHC21 isoform X1 [Chiloscyllium plagiosum]|uniref:palmitoyltransferase ZDHHC21 isoform X1 n=2 Tax=Chiloscyllium plagiosum TaxID=36176 RepID=UPI001CB7F940|nr:palmitoyltransferase ZDHHC21 isoform X1 [Chiloscyllium plagiosum]XP_043570298.1 palmitoyltransferase ZDHHC21 isoform X1 [Chiloscyllium plagiosum]XP_043570306.1 palmitoyltransferase ZDHHC21 isoform X1 [Chiloscyllium plagiosum]